MGGKESNPFGRPNRRDVLKGTGAAFGGGLFPMRSAAIDDEGYFGVYYNLPSSHPDVEDNITTGGRERGLVRDRLPLQETDAGDEYYNAGPADWYTERYRSFARVDGSLEFGSDFLPIENSKPGDPYHFAVHWRATIEAPANDSYSLSVTSDDDAWVFVDERLEVDNGGLHPAQTRSNTVELSEGSHTLDIFFAERQTFGSVFSFSPDSRLTIRPRTPDTGLQTAIDEKLALADQITDISQTIDERSRVEPVLEGLRSAVGDELSDGETFTERDALEAVDRLKSVENVSEYYVAGLGPRSLGSPENPNTLVGIPDSRKNWNAGGDFLEIAISVALEIFFAGFALRSFSKTVNWNVAIKSLNRGLRLLNRAKNALLGTFARTFPRIAARVSAVVDDIGPFYAEAIQDGASGAATIAAEIADRVAEEADEISAAFAARFEQSIDFAASASDKLAEVDNRVDVSDGSPPDLGGENVDGAEISRTGIDYISAGFDTLNAISIVVLAVTLTVDLISGVIALIAGLSDGPLPIVEGAIGLANTLINVGTALLGAGGAYAVLQGTTFGYNLTVDAIVQGDGDVIPVVPDNWE